MGSNGEIRVTWPKSIENSPYQMTIEKLFNYADDPSEQGSVQFSKLFVPDGELVARGHVCKGHQEILQFRQGAWNVITARKHKAIKIYVSEGNRNDVLVLGAVIFGLKDGSSVNQEFLANFIFDEENGETGLIRSYKAWLDSKPLADLIAASKMRINP